MMYLGIFVFVVLTSPGLVQSNKDEPFKCPDCNVRGDQAKCDKISKLKNCTQENPICEIIKYSFGRIIRQCTDMDTYKTSLSYCEQHQNCEKAMCTESECMAEFTSEQSEGAFTCPVCEGESLKACDDNIQNEKCQEKNPVCVLSQVISLSKGVTTYRRQCSSKDSYNNDRDRCDQSFGKCSVVMCEESGCKAELPNPVTPAPFMCPVCFADGQNADSDCESIVENKPCPEEYPVCALTVSTESADEKFRARDCFSRQDFEEEKDDCEYYQNCKMVMCETSGCKAEFSVPEAFMCPVCSAHGENAHNECEDNIKNKTCPQTDPVCVLKVSTESSIFKYRRRYCDSGKWYPLTRDYCEKNKDCATAMCNTSHCVAELPASEPVKPLECPFCSGKGKNAQKDCDVNITYKPCKSTDWVCGVFKQGMRFRRGCTNEKRVNKIKKFCLRPRVAKPCVTAVCNESRCKAELPVSEQSFSCPACAGKTLEDCDKNLKQENCRQEDPVCALFRSTYDDVTVFERLCYGKDSYSSVKDACAMDPKSCAVTMCDASGCKAEWAK